jgi:ferredoxin
MKVRVDKSRCQGHAMCNAVASAVYPIDDEGFVTIDVAEVTEKDAELAELGVETCPERAISIEE